MWSQRKSKRLRDPACADDARLLKSKVGHTRPVYRAGKCFANGTVSYRSIADLSIIVTPDLIRGP